MDMPSTVDRRRFVRPYRHAQAGGFHLLTVFTCRRHALFADWRCAWAACAQLGAASTWGDAELLCWVLMPDCWHGLVRLGPEIDLPDLVHLAKGTTARAVNLARGRPGMVWEPGFRDHLVREEVDLVAAARHLVLSPVRARLARRAAEYPYWDARWLAPEVS